MRSCVISARGRPPASRPSRSATTRSAARSISCRRWVMNITAIPARFRSAMTSQQLFGLGQGQAGGWFIKDNQPRVHRQRLGDLYHLALRERQVCDWRVRAERGADTLQQRRDRVPFARVGQEARGRHPAAVPARSGRYRRHPDCRKGSAPDARRPMPAPMLSADTEALMFDPIDRDGAAVGHDERRPGFS